MDAMVSVASANRVSSDPASAGTAAHLGLKAEYPSVPALVLPLLCQQMPHLLTLHMQPDAESEHVEFPSQLCALNHRSIRHDC